jgi:hypothetical protein
LPKAAPGRTEPTAIHTGERFEHGVVCEHLSDPVDIVIVPNVMKRWTNASPSRFLMQASQNVTHHRMARHRLSTRMRSRVEPD